MSVTPLTINKSMLLYGTGPTREQQLSAPEDQRKWPVLCVYFKTKYHDGPFSSAGKES